MTQLWPDIRRTRSPATVLCQLWPDSRRSLSTVTWHSKDEITSNWPLSTVTRHEGRGHHQLIFQTRCHSHATFICQSSSSVLQWLISVFVADSVLTVLTTRKASCIQISNLSWSTTVAWKYKQFWDRSRGASNAFEEAAVQCKCILLRGNNSTTV